jgi:hypothetical protein
LHSRHSWFWAECNYIALQQWNAGDDFHIERKKEKVNTEGEEGDSLWTVLALEIQGNPCILQVRKLKLK